MTDAPPLPAALQIEVTGACNLRCHMCLVRYRPPLDRVHHSLSLADVIRLADDVPTLERVTLQGLGEPLLVPDLVEMVRHLSSRGISVGFNTNGTLLTRDKGRALVASGLSWLRISIDGATAATFEAIRDGASFDRVVANAGAFAEECRTAEADVDLAIAFVAMRSNVAELPDLVSLAAELGVPAVRVQNLSHDFDDCDPAGGYAEIRAFATREALWSEQDHADAERAFDSARRRAAELGVGLWLPRLERRPPGSCSWPWDSAYVTHDGTVQPCCMVMGTDRVSLGDVSTTAFPVVWRGRAYRDFRDGLTSGPAHEVCQGCSLYRGVF